MRKIVSASLPLVVAASLSIGAAPRGRFELTTWGMPGSPRFIVTLSPNGDLTVIRESMPLTTSGPTVTKVVRVLTANEADEVVLLAEHSNDFSVGCMTVADGTSARLWIDDSMSGIERKCDMAERWPLGDQTRKFLEQINAYLPKNMHVF